MRDDMTRGTPMDEQPDDDRRDPVIERAVAALGALPPADPAATARILAAVEARRRERAAGIASPATSPVPAPEPAVLDLDAARRRRQGVRRFGLRAIAGVGLAAAVGGFMVRGLVPAGAPAADSATDAVPMIAAAESLPAGPETALVPVASDDVTRRLQEEAVPHAVPFMLAAPDARTVSVVGDFNGWDAEATPLRRDRNGVWTAIVPMSAGRHSYAFLVDGRTTLDPRAPSATDPDLGTQHSVLLVGAP